MCPIILHCPLLYIQFSSLNTHVFNIYRIGTENALAEKQTTPIFVVGVYVCSFNVNIN